MKLSNWTTILVLWALKTAKITGQDKTRITNALLANIGILSIKDAIYINEQNQIMVRGKPVTDVDMANSIRQGASAILDNGTRKIVKEQLRTEASKILLYQSKIPEDLLFAKAIVWVELTEDRIYQELSK